MRIAPVGLIASTEAEVLSWSDTVTAITHNHPDAMNSAQAVALAIFWARRVWTIQPAMSRLTTACPGCWGGWKRAMAPTPDMCT